ncbi:BnaC08g04210D [Brassica napus]|uniref:BnaC08g04210D protein n=1 Tax=Brassica napus TaxID=3708 RepID=A0A078FYC2_BRANA|nr:BnaC08g04210D [Brassica napus]
MRTEKSCLLNSCLLEASIKSLLSGFNQIGKEEYFYRSEDLFNLNNWIDEANALRTFRLRCYQAGNLEAIYMRGIREFVDRMTYMITTSLSSCHWVIEPVFVVSLDGSRTRWTCNRCFWQCAAWDFCNDIHLTSGHWPIED